ncbi:hypothetical protein CL618_02750 [archaeon]|nr:hypothetical protein [archaeon]|tara:strand:+ start:1713 stop:1910 length:198 start_codon:yes stop_codon:yes gene_type:complete
MKNKLIKEVIIVTIIYFILRFLLRSYLGGELLEVVMSAFIFGIVYYILINYLKKKNEKTREIKEK